MNFNQSKKIHSAFILGSTSDMAKAICHELVQKGCRRFHLVARDRNKNKGLIQELQAYEKVDITEETTDLHTDKYNYSQSNIEIGNYDLYLITAGSIGNNILARTDSLEALRITDANYSGIIPWINAIATSERLKYGGRLWIFSSVAADRGRPSNYYYGAAKSALKTLCEGLLLRCHGTPFKVRILQAGFLATSMTKNKVPKLLCAKPKSIAKDLLRRPNRSGIEYLPWWWFFIMIVIKVAPSKLVSKL